jgi:hypothetical protein
MDILGEMENQVLEKIHQYDKLLSRAVPIRRLGLAEIQRKLWKEAKLFTGN